MEKVTLTKEQAHEFESFKTLRSSLEQWARDKQDPNSAHSIIHELTFDEMARAYYIGYEIEPEEPKFQAGSEVIDTTSKNCPVITVTTQDEKHLFGYWGDNVKTCVQKKNARFATSEEVFWTKTLGRKEIDDYRTGDVMVTTYGQTFLRGKEMTAVGFEYSGIYPAESFKPFPKDE